MKNECVNSKIPTQQINSFQVSIIITKIMIMKINMKKLRKLGVTYDYLSSQLLQELIFVCTDLMNIYVRSANENEGNSVDEIIK